MRRVVAVLGALVLLVAVLGTPRDETLAAWTDQQTATGSFSALTLAPPEITGCQSANVLGASRVRLNFRYTSTTPTPTPVLYYSNGSALNLTPLTGATYTLSGPDGAGVYTVDYNTGLLGTLLGGTVVVGVAAQQYGWTSAPAAARTTVPLLVGTAPCTTLT